jgi:hypothetical protein
MTDIDTAKMEENALTAKLALHKMFVHGFKTKNPCRQLFVHLFLYHIHADMFLSSFAESRKWLPSTITVLPESPSAITMPMGISGGISSSSVNSTKEILKILADAEKLFWADLNCGRGKVPSVRNATLSLALIKALQMLLGRSEKRVDCHGAQPLG